VLPINGGQPTGISPLIFADDFERGSSCRWSVTVP